MNIDSLPEKMVLQPIQSVPLPRNYHFTVGWAPGWSPPRRDALGLYVGHELVGALANEDKPGTRGFNKLFESVQGFAMLNNLWGQTVDCRVVAMGGPNATLYVARSNKQPLRLPVRPLHDIPLNQFAWTMMVGDSPPPVALAVPNGRRLYRSEPLGSSAFPKLWYVRPDNTLEDSDSLRGFDRLTFWQSVFGLSMKETNQLKFEDVMAKLLNAHAAAPIPAVGKLAELMAALPPNGNLGRCVMWTQTRFVCMAHHSPNNLFAMEFDAAGFRSMPFSAWLAAESQSTVWNHRRMNHPTPAPASGLLSLA